MILGIHESNRLVYEGDSFSNGYPLSPLPLISQVSFHADIEKAKLGLKESSYFYDYDFIFREDSYDPVSRSRRGRIYKASNSKPETWSIIPHGSHLVRRTALTAEGQLQGQRLFAFHNVTLRSIFKDHREIKSLNFLIGIRPAFTKWAIVNYEVAFNGEEIVTLRSVNTLDVIPDLDYGKIDPSEHSVVRGTVDKFLEVVYSASAESIIDRAGEVCISLIHAVLRVSNPETKGLSLDSAIKLMKDSEQFSERKMLLSAMELLRLFHSRGKLTFQDRHKTRSVNYYDSQAAIDCLSTVIFELDLAV